MHVPSGLFAQGHYQHAEYGFPLSDNSWGNALICSPASSPGCSAQGADEKKKDASQWLVQGGIAKNWFGIGNTALYGEYGKAIDWGALTGGTGRDYPVGGIYTAPFNTPYLNSNNFLGIQNVTDTEVRVFGFGLVQNIDAAAATLYLGYRNFSAKLNGVEVSGACAQLPAAAAQKRAGGVVTRAKHAVSEIRCTQTPTGRAPSVEDMHAISAGVRIQF